MDDYVSREEAIAAAFSAKAVGNSAYRDVYDTVSRLRLIPAADVRPVRWIPVTERLPENVRDVQITVFWHDAWRTMLGYYDGSFWHLYAPMHSDIADVEVIGWMEKPAPMPTPPKEETDNG